MVDILGIVANKTLSQEVTQEQMKRK